jgi:hypothetical protein
MARMIQIALSVGKAFVNADLIQHISPGAHGAGCIINFGSGNALQTAEAAEKVAEKAGWNGRSHAANVSAGIGNTVVLRIPQQLPNSVELLGPGLLFITNLPAGVAVGGPFSFRYEFNWIARDERATVRGCVARQLSSRTCRTLPLPATRRFRKLSIIEHGVHQAERNPGNEGFHVRKGTRQPHSRGIMAGDLARTDSLHQSRTSIFPSAVVTPMPDLAPTIR